MSPEPVPLADYVAPIKVHENPCLVGWSGGCGPWSCLCKNDVDHDGRHVCICGSWKPADWEGLRTDGA